MKEPKYKVYHKHYSFASQTGDDIHELINKAERDMHFRARKGLWGLDSQGSREYVEYKEKIQMCLFIYGVFVVFALLDYLYHNLRMIWEIDAILVWGAIIDTLFLIYYSFMYLLRRKKHFTYLKEREALLLAFQKEWQIILKEYYESCEKMNIKPIRYDTTINFDKLPLHYSSFSILDDLN